MVYWFRVILAVSLLIGIICFIAVADVDYTYEYKIHEYSSSKNYSAPYYFEYYFIPYEGKEFPNFSRLQFVKAFEIISNDTDNNFIFTETTNKTEADFIIEYQKKIKSEDDGYKTLGLSYTLGKEFYPYRENYQHCKITITYYSKRCNNYPTIEIHEIMHGLGLNHQGNKIMSPYATCSTLARDETIIKDLYEEWEIEEIEVSDLNQSSS